MSAQFIGLGVGPGDPELLTMKAYRLIQQADMIAFLANENGSSQAQDIAQIALAASQAANPKQQLMSIIMPMKNDRSAANKVYDQAAADIAELIFSGKNVAFLCEGDPLFYGSFSYLLDRLTAKDIRCDVVPGVTSFNAASSRLKQPLSMLTESVAIMNGRHSEQELVTALQNHDSLVIMKAGPYREKILAALKETKRSNDARYLEYVGRDNEYIETDVAQLPAGKGPYFSLFIILASDRPA